MARALPRSGQRSAPAPQRPSASRFSLHVSLVTRLGPPGLSPVLPRRASSSKKISLINTRRFNARATRDTAHTAHTHQVHRFHRLAGPYKPYKNINSRAHLAAVRSAHTFDSRRFTKPVTEPSTPHTPCRCPCVATTKVQQRVVRATTRARRRGCPSPRCAVASRGEEGGWCGGRRLQALSLAGPRLPRSRLLRPRLTRPRLTRPRRRAWRPPLPFLRRRGWRGSWRRGSRGRRRRRG